MILGGGGGSCGCASAGAIAAAAAANVVFGGMGRVTTPALAASFLAASATAHFYPRGEY